ncbi:MAG: hypothetical protein WAW02_06880 [Sideroxyarcus sp.]
MLLDMITKQSKSQNEPTSSPLSQASSHANWKDHPLVIAAVATAATLSLCILFFNEVVIPTRTAYLTNQLAALPGLPKKISDAEAKIELLEKQLTETRIKLLEARNINLFATSNPYPPGFDQVKIGDPVKKVSMIYSQSHITHDEELGSYAVKLEDCPFEEAYYEYDTRSPKDGFFLIAFQHFGKSPDGRVSQVALKNKLTEALGKRPILSVIGKFKHETYTWKVSPNLGVRVAVPGNGYELYSLR